MQRIVPYLTYQDAPAAIEFLCKAFGFTERFRYDDKDGRIGHAELELEGDTLMLASVYEGFGESPLNLPAVSASVFIVLDDVDAHHQRARDAGATIVAEPHDDHGSRVYRAMDLEGQRFFFSSKRTA